MGFAMQKFKKLWVSKLKSSHLMSKKKKKKKKKKSVNYKFVQNWESRELLVRDLETRLNSKGKKFFFLKMTMPDFNCVRLFERRVINLSQMEIFSATSEDVPNLQDINIYK